MADTDCKLLCWKGGFLQKFATARLYVLLYGIVGFVQFAVISYQVAILSTVEKRFKITSKFSGLIISGWDIGTIICVTYLVFYGSTLHKPRFVGFGVVLVSISCLMWLVPHIIYGPGISMSLSDKAIITNETQRCEFGELPDEVCEGGSESISVTIIFLVANILFGIGSCFYWTLGLTYIDDNASKRKIPFYLSITMLIRMFGPTLGYMLATYSLSIYIDPTLTPNFSASDPKWIGAWWYGFIILFILLLGLLVFVCPFPRHIPKAYKRKIDAGIVVSDTSQPTFKDFKLKAYRLMKNKIFVANTISSTFFVFGLFGLGVFGPKYFETQFHLSTSEASFATGSIGLVCTGFGILCSGIIITLFKPSSRSMALWNVIVECFDFIGHFIFAFLGCSFDNLQGHWGENNEWTLLEDCNKNCSCPLSIKYTPLCSGSADMLFYSPCHAGCSIGSLNKTSQAFENCECAPSVPLIQGPCPRSNECVNEFYTYIIIICLLQFFSASGRAGNTLIQFRSVQAEDKAVSFAITEGFISIFAFVPAPIIFGILVDYTCLIWGESCGVTGNCWLYNSKSMRYFLNFTSCAFIFLGTLADVVVWIYSSEVNMFDEVEKEDEKHQGEELLEKTHQDSKLDSLSS